MYILICTLLRLVLLLLKLSVLNSVAELSRVYSALALPLQGATGCLANDEATLHYIALRVQSASNCKSQLAILIVCVSVSVCVYVCVFVCDSLIHLLHWHTRQLTLRKRERERDKLRQIRCMQLPNLLPSILLHVHWQWLYTLGFYLRWWHLHLLHLCNSMPTGSVLHVQVRTQLVYTD